MALGHSNFRRQHSGAAHRRAPQNGFDPDAYLSSLEDARGRHTDLFPTLTPIDIPTPTTTSTIPSVTPTDTPAIPSTISTTTTSTSTSTSVTPTTTETTSSSTLVVAPVVPTTTPVVTTTAPPKTAFVTTSISHTSSNTAVAASVSPSTSSVPDTTSSSSAGPLVGGIIAGIAVLIAVIFAVVFFIRRSRKRDSFSEGDFRRSAMVLNDPPTHEDTVARGFNPSPGMIERHTASPAPTFGTQYGHPGAAASDYSMNNAGYGASMNSFGPGQIINVNTAPVHPMYTPQPQSPYEQYYPQSIQSPVLTRQASNASSEVYPAIQSPSQLKRESLPANDYVDLNRSSVSPYQAAQYVEISRRLNAEVPEGLRTAEIDRDLPPLPPVDESPFDDPASAPPSPGAQYAVDRRHIEEPIRMQDPAPRPTSTDSFGADERALEFPVPPSPVVTATSRYRIESMPPMLPEINVQSRVSVSEYPMLSARDSGAPSGMLTPGVASATGSRFPMTPSPLASSFGLPSPMPAAAFADAPPTPRMPPAVPHDPKKRDTSYSMYDPDDAYGGI